MCMLLHLSFKKIVPFVLKVVIWALKAKKWPCPPLPINAQNTVKKLGIDLSFSSSLVCAGFRRKKLTYLSYHPTFSVHGKKHSACHSFNISRMSSFIDLSL